MSAVANVHQAKSNLSKLLEQAENGDEVIIARAGQPVARLVALQPERPTRQPGALKNVLDPATCDALLNDYHSDDDANWG